MTPIGVLRKEDDSMQPRDPLAGRIRLYRIALILGITVSLLLAVFCYERGVQIHRLEQELRDTTLRANLAERFRSEMERQQRELDRMDRLHYEMIRQQRGALQEAQIAEARAQHLANLALIQAARAQSAEVIARCVATERLTTNIQR